MRRALQRLAVVVTIALTAQAARAASGGRSVFSPQHQAVDQATQYIVAGRFLDAEPLLRRAIAIDRGLPEAHYNLGVVLRATGRYEPAIAEYQIAERLFPRGETSKRARSLYGAAIAALQEYVRFDSRFASAQPAVAIAREHLCMEQQLAQTQPRPPGTQKAAR
jgi:tetratricopeptide (TPR) repeat protein